MKAVFLLGRYGCVFHGTGNSAQLCQNFGISGGGVEHPKPPSPPRYVSELQDIAGRGSILYVVAVRTFLSHSSVVMFNELMCVVTCI